MYTKYIPQNSFRFYTQLHKWLVTWLLLRFPTVTRIHITRHLGTLTQFPANTMLHITYTVGESSATVKYLEK